MSKQNDDLTRREALKTLSAGVGVIATLPVLGGAAAAQNHKHPAPKAAVAPKPEPLKFFTPEESRVVIEMSERIIPADDSSPGAKEARVAEFIDRIVSIAPDEIKRTWREGLAAVDKKSRDMFGKGFADATVDQQVELLKEISKNEKSPKSVEERFFKTVKNATIDGYYTSEIGIHKELKYKGNSYIKEFVGCTHAEHQK
jgi:gluconate 2-dehydrogenase gamma chain